MLNQFWALTRLQCCMCASNTLKGTIVPNILVCNSHKPYRPVSPGIELCSRKFDIIVVIRDVSSESWLVWGRILWQLCLRSLRFVHVKGACDNHVVHPAKREPPAQDRRQATCQQFV